MVSKGEKLKKNDLFQCEEIDQSNNLSKIEKRIYKFFEKENLIMTNPIEKQYEFFENKKEKIKIFKISSLPEIKNSKIINDSIIAKNFSTSNLLLRRKKEIKIEFSPQHSHNNSDNNNCNFHNGFENIIEMKNKFKKSDFFKKK